MSIVDDRGRVGGRVNVVDLTIGLLILVLVPAAYGAYLLFRDPTPALSAVLPRSLQQGPNLQVEVHGEHFRPYMRVAIGDQQGVAFWFVNATTAVIPLPELKPGTYDVVLYDYLQEVARLPRALTIDPPPAPPVLEVEVTGALTALTADQAQKIAAGLKFFDGTGAIAEVLSVGPPVPDVLRVSTGDTLPISVPLQGRVQVPVRVRASCVVRTDPATGKLECTVGGVPLARDAYVRYPGLNTSLIFHVTDVRPPETAAK